MIDGAEQADEYDAVVLGAGVSGLVSASVLIEKGARRVLVLDEYPQVGGNHLDFSIAGCTFDVGSLIFQDDSPLVHRFPELLPRYVPIKPTWSRINPQGRVAAYPISMRDDILAAGPIELIRMAASLIDGRIRYRRQRNARDFAVYWMGARIAQRTGLEAYIERFYGRPASEIDLEFVRARMMWIPELASVTRRTAAAVASVRRRLARSRLTPVDPPAPPNTQLVRPREGFAHLYEPAVESLRAAGVVFGLGAELRSIRREGTQVVVRTSAGEFSAATVVSTIPLHRALVLVGEASEPLPAVALITLMCSFIGERGFASSILYNFTESGAWKRLTMHSDFYGQADGREYFAVEVVISDEVGTVERAIEEFRCHCAAVGLFDGDLRVEGTHVLENVYPVFTDGSARRALADVARLREHGVQSLGKQGAFEYQPTARISTRNAEQRLGGTVSPE